MSLGGQGAEVAIDVPGENATVEVRILSQTMTVCAQIPCVTRMKPGAFDLDVRRKDASRSGCSVPVQISRKPTVLLLSLPPLGKYGECGVTLWSPEDGVIYQGEIR